MTEALLRLLRETIRPKQRDYFGARDASLRCGGNINEKRQGFAANAKVLRSCLTFKGHWPKRSQGNTPPASIAIIRLLSLHAFYFAMIAQTKLPAA
ncbi:MAG: hypothetical protein INF79_12775 [Roseomonas sp.]|nr:hypothetical protein [Roseomonas sp.]